ncbi:hypothetical protein ACFFR3_07310 [Nonomuraea salmonea]|uniref:GntR family transcriptional regulator n=1 Tax=Nonomuraea salmonea TaxID=46181 RepID=A0ABV5NGB3_9ACTN
MQLTLDLDSEVPIHQQIRDRIVEAIAERQAREGGPLPPRGNSPRISASTSIP